MIFDKNRFAFSFCYIYIFVVGIWAMISCENLIIPDDDNASEGDIFREFADEIREHYIFFNLDLKYKHDSILDAGQELVGLFELDTVFELTIQQIADPQLEIYTTSADRYAYVPPFEPSFNARVINNYVDSLRVVNDVYSYGYIGLDSIAYLHVKTLGTDQDESQYEILGTVLEIIGQTSKRIVVDVRTLQGVDWQNARLVSSYFNALATPYMHWQYRTGPEMTDLSEWQPIDMIDNRTVSFEAIGVMQGKDTRLAGELFIYGMENLENVVQVGDTTAGIFGLLHSTELSNGYILQYANAHYGDFERVSHQFEGITPDIFQMADNILNPNQTVDRILDRTLEAVRSR